MKIWVYTVTHNEARILPFFLRHYAAFCDRITVIDDNSTDGTRDLVRACPIAVLEDYAPTSGLDDRDFIRVARQTYPQARGQADWVIWVDPDELLYHPRLKDTLQRLLDSGVQVPQTRGFQMISETFPTCSGQIWEEVEDGIEDPVYAKPCLFRPECDMQWDPGKHYVHGPFNRGKSAELKVLHYRCLGLDYLRERHARNFKRCSQANLDSGLGVGVYPGHTGHMSEAWFKAVLPTRRPVLEHSTFHELVRVIHRGMNPNEMDMADEDAELAYGRPEPQMQPTWGSEHPWLHETIERLQPQVLIEVGTFLGRSAIHQAQKLKALGLDSALICVDTWLGDEHHWIELEVRPLLNHRRGRPEFYHTFLVNVTAAGLDGFIIPLPIDSVSGARLLSRLGVKADMIYVDGGHAGGEVYRDLVNFWSLLRPGGAMLMDDYADGRFPGLTADVNRFAQEQRLALEVDGHKARVFKS